MNVMVNRQLLRFLCEYVTLTVEAGHHSALGVRLAAQRAGVDPGIIFSKVVQERDLLRPKDNPAAQPGDR